MWANTYNKDWAPGCYLFPLIMFSHASCDNMCHFKHFRFRLQACIYITLIYDHKMSIHKTFEAFRFRF